MSLTYQFENRIGSQERQPIRHHTFNVEEGTEWLCFDFVLSIKKSWFKVLVYDADGMLRLQFLYGRSPNRVVLTQDKTKTSSLTVPGYLTKGEWVVEIIGAELKEDIHYKINLVLGKGELPVGSSYHLLGENVWLTKEEGQSTFSYNNYNWSTKTKLNKKWYKGDFHTHTIHSDGKLTPEEGMRQAEKMGLDFFVATEHHVLPTGWVKGSALPIPGVEVTSSKGHFNALGPRTWIDWRTNQEDGGMETEKGIQRILDDVKKASGVRSLNHAMLKPWHWQFKDTPINLFDVMEIWNDPTYPANVLATEQALVLWNKLWMDGHQIWGIGGSDAHLRPEESYVENGEPSVIGDPATFVFADGLSASNILKGIKKGHVYVSRKPLIDTEITANEHPVILGEKIIEQGEIDISYKISFSQLEEGSQLNWFENGEKVVTHAIENGKTYEQTFNWNSEDYNWLRIEVRSHDGKLLAFNNPIYTAQKEPVLLTWGQLLESVGFTSA